MEDRTAFITEFYKKYYLRDNPSFAETAAAMSVIREYPAGHVLYQPGQPIDLVHILVTGGLKSVWDPEDGTRPLVVSMSYMPGVPVLPIQIKDTQEGRFFTTVTVTLPSSFICIPYTAVRRLAADHREITDIYLRMKQNQLAFHVRHSLLLRQYNNNLEALYACCVNEHPTQVANASVEDLASWLGVSMYHLSRVKNKWKRENPEAFERLMTYKV